jgi:transposase
MKQRYETDLSDEQWDEVRALVESTKGRKARVSRREIVNAILYVARTVVSGVCYPRTFPIGARSIRATIVGLGMAR